MRNVIVILDPAHGVNVKGKCSPDGEHREYLWSRERVKRISDMLTNLGYEVYMTTGSEYEPGLSVRRNFATQVRKNERKLLLSFHNNAAGDGSKWLNARGVEVYTSPGVTKADICADFLIRQFKKDFPHFKMRYNKDSYLERDKEAAFTVLMGSGYMGVLIEWLFQDNIYDVALLRDAETNRKFEASVVEAIEAINNYFSK